MQTQLTSNQLVDKLAERPWLKDVQHIGAGVYVAKCPRCRKSLANWCANPTEGAAPVVNCAGSCTDAEVLATILNDGVDPEDPVELDWQALYDDDGEEEWLIPGFLIAGRQHELAAPKKVGKSLLALEWAAALASGRAIFGRPAGEPVSVLYVDKENHPRLDVLARLEAFGYSAAELANLHYFSFPPLVLDTAAGGARLERLIDQFEPVLVVLDNFQRVTEGKENDADTVRAYYRHTVEMLKRHDVASLRLDNTGHENVHRSRGSSAKGDDVDAGYVLKEIGREDEGRRVTLELSCPYQRGIGIAEKTKLTRVGGDDGGLRHELTAGPSWPAGTAAAVELLNRLEVPLGVSRRAARKLMAAAGETAARDLTLGAALRFRRERNDLANLVENGAAPLAEPLSNRPREPLRGSPGTNHETAGQRPAPLTGTTRNHSLPEVGTRFPPLRGGTSGAPDPNEPELEAMIDAIFDNQETP